MKRLLFIVVALAITNLANAQTASPELVSSAGESFNNASYQLDWSIGECITQTQSAGSYVITQGFHQNSYVVTAVEDLAKDINISVYPNPTADLLTVNLEASARPSSVLTITDLNGKVLQQAEATADKEQLDFSNYANGVYFLSVKQGNQLIKSFKIIKN